MYIQPSSTLILLKGCPCDPDYNNTLYFATADLQETYFKTLAKYTFSDLSYIRVNRGEIRIEKKTEDLYDCNYMMFQNTAFGNKWFYAFVKGVDYVSNTTASIKFEIDEIQTWYFETVFNQCVIQRTHPKDDTIGSNRVDEQLNIGEYVFKKLPNMFRDEEGTGHFLVLSTLDYSDSAHIKDSQGAVYFGLYSGYTVVYIPDAPTLLRLIAQTVDQGKGGGIKAIYYTPERIGTAFKNLATAVNHPAYFDYGVPRNYSDIDGYKPKNNKLYTWPYNGLYVTDNNGTSANYRFENFPSECHFNLNFVANPVPTAALVPLNYNGVTGENYNEKFKISVTADCVWTEDSYSQYIADNGGLGGIIASMISGPILSAAGGLATGALVGGPVGAAAGTASVLTQGLNVANNAVNTIVGMSRAMTMPDQAKGKLCGLLNCISGHWGFDSYYVTVRKEFAEMIDGVFDRVGYAVNALGTPERKNRPHWTYIKTQGCSLLGSVPSDSARKICQIHDNGITYWVSPNEVGNYSIDNSPEGEPPTPVDPVEPSTPENFIPRLSEDGILNNPYWYKDNIYYQSGYGMPNCTCYALGRWYEIQGSAKAFNFPGYWDGMEWYQMCADAGYQTSKTVPMVGACMSWTHGTAGHVAIVERINYNEDGSIYSVTTSNSAWGGTFWYEQEILASSGWKYRDDQTFNGFGYHPSLTAQAQQTGGRTDGT